MMSLILPRRGAVAIAVVFSLVMAACSKSPESRFYLLHPPAGAGKPAEAMSNAPVIFVDPVTLSPYVDRSQLVTRVDGTRVTFAEFDVWAESVSGLITRKLVDEIATHFNPDTTMATPRRRYLEPGYRVLVEVIRFDTDSAGVVTLDARWTLLAGADERYVDTGRERIEETIADPASFDERIAALSRTLTVLSDRIASKIQQADVKRGR
jgi:hypothetical protein